MTDTASPEPRFSLLRDALALVVTAVACPLALFGGSMLGCVGQGFDPSCALNAIVISPVLLLAAGVIAGIASRGWTGLMITFVGALIGMSAILVLSFGIGDPVPVDPISGVIATVWFYAPIAIGYGAGRLVSRLLATRGNDSSDD